MAKKKSRAKQRRPKTIAAEPDATIAAEPDATGKIVSRSEWLCRATAEFVRLRWRRP